LRAGASGIDLASTNGMAGGRPKARDDRKSDELEKAFDELARAVPDSLRTAIDWMRTPRARFVRLPLGILCIIGSFLWFLPVLGLWFLPLGLLLIAQDVPFLRRPVGRMTVYLLDRWTHFRKWWARKRKARAERLRNESR
jgi:hypothetical protein